MAVNKTFYKGDNDGKGPSPRIWADCPVGDMLQDPNIGYHFFDDFLTWGDTTLPTATDFPTSHGYQGFGSSGATITDGATDGGAITFTEATDNESIALASLAKPFKITADDTDNSITAKKLWFEARLKSSLVADTGSNFFLGLIDVSTLAVGLPLTTAGALADENMVGWHKKEADGDAVDFSYKANGVSAVDLETGASALVADTYIKLGFVFDGTTTLKWYVNGVASTTTYTVPGNTGTDFPADVNLGLCFGHMAAATSPGTHTMDWWRCAQLR